MRITNVQQTNYNPQFNGLLRITNLKTGEKIETEVSKTADKVLTKMFSRMTEAGYFEGATFPCRSDLQKYFAKAAELTVNKDIGEFANELSSDCRGIGHYYPEQWGATYSLNVNNHIQIFHRYR